jgi:hypothetical protein
MERTLRQFTPQQKAILRGHLIVHVPVSELCDEQRLHPTLFCRWQKAFFENGAPALEVDTGEFGRSGTRPIRDGGHPPIGRMGQAEELAADFARIGDAHHGDRPWGRSWL